jgi:hypothetical protein
MQTVKAKRVLRMEPYQRLKNVEYTTHLPRFGDRVIRLYLFRLKYKHIDNHTVSGYRSL